MFYTCFSLFNSWRNMGYLPGMRCLCPLICYYQNPLRSCANTKVTSVTDITALVLALVLSLLSAVGLLIALYASDMFVCPFQFCILNSFTNWGPFYLIYFRHYITKTRLFKYIENFTTKTGKFADKKLWYFSYFCLKHRLCELVRTASVRRF